MHISINDAINVEILELTKMLNPNPNDFFITIVFNTQTNIDALTDNICIFLE